jgi:hypothetical protein
MLLRVSLAAVEGVPHVWLRTSSQRNLLVLRFRTAVSHAGRSGPSGVCLGAAPSGTASETLFRVAAVDDVVLQAQAGTFDHRLAGLTPARCQTTALFGGHGTVGECALVMFNQMAPKAHACALQSGLCCAVRMLCLCRCSFQCSPAAGTARGHRPVSAQLLGMSVLVGQQHGAGLHRL